MDNNALQRDRLLFQRIASGDASAFAEFYDAYAVKSALFVSRFLRSELWAEEIVQDCFLKLWSIRETLTSIDYPGSFLFRMIANRTKDHLKRRGHEVKLQQHLVHFLQNAHTNTTEELVDYQAGEKLFRQAIQQLPVQRALIYKLRHEQGLTYDEIASQLNLSKNTVRNQLNLAMQNIRTYLLHHGDITGVLAIIIFSKYF